MRVHQIKWNGGSSTSVIVVYVVACVCVCDVSSFLLSNFLCSLLFLISVSGMDHVRVHPRFLHSNATSHKWALGGMVFLFILP
jgi:hypothetical protein